MARSSEHDDKPLDPAQARIVRRLRGLMLFTSLVMVVGFLVVFGVIAYRLSSGTERGRLIEAAVTLPKGARVISTAAAEGKLLLTIEVDGITEVRMFDLATLEPRGRLTLRNEP